MACSVLLRQPTGQRISKVRKQQKKIQFCQSYSFVNRKVWYHQIWIPNNLVFIKSGLMFIGQNILYSLYHSYWLTQTGQIVGHVLDGTLFSRDQHYTINPVYKSSAWNYTSVCSLLYLSAGQAPAFFWGLMRLMSHEIIKFCCVAETGQ